MHVYIQASSLKLCNLWLQRLMLWGSSQLSMTTCEILNGAYNKFGVDYHLLIRSELYLINVIIWTGPISKNNYLP